jgi:hypothetical protein
MIAPNNTVKCVGNSAGGLLFSDPGITPSNIDSIIESDDDTRLANPRKGEVEGLNNVANISMGFDHACASLKDGNMKCWGFGLMGDGQPGYTGFAERDGYTIYTVPVLQNVVVDSTFYDFKITGTGQIGVQQ